jgi:Mn-dependent DtxR family transcriptional regulator
MKNSARRSSTRTTVSQEDYLKAIRKMQEVEQKPIRS